MLQDHHRLGSLCRNHQVLSISVTRLPHRLNYFLYHLSILHIEVVLVIRRIYC